MKVISPYYNSEICWHTKPANTDGFIIVSKLFICQNLPYLTSLQLKLWKLWNFGSNLFIWSAAWFWSFIAMDIYKLDINLSCSVNITNSSNLIKITSYHCLSGQNMYNSSTKGEMIYTFKRKIANPRCDWDVILVFFLMSRMWECDMTKTCDWDWLLIQIDMMGIRSDKYCFMVIIIDKVGQRWRTETNHRFWLIIEVKYQI